MADQDTHTHPAAGKALPPVRRRRWPRRLAIGVAVAAALLAGVYWYGGRESTLQTLAQQVATWSGGHIVITGVSGSLYGSMHLGHVVYRSPDQLIIGDNIDIDWSPFQYLSKGIAINKLHVASLTTQSLRDTGPARMPASLAPPFQLAIEEARLARVTVIPLGATAGTVLSDLRFKLHGDRQKWVLRDASALTPYGIAAANASIGAVKPFKLEGAASLTQSQSKAGQKPARLNLRASGDLNQTGIAADGQAGPAVGDAKFTLAPFNTIPLRAMTINGRGIDPGFFNPSLPTADLSIAVTASIAPNRDISGSVAVDNRGPAGAIDHQRLPLRAMRGKLGGNLASLQVSDVLVDFGAAGKFTGSGAVERTMADTGLGTAEFVLHTDRLDLKGLHSRMKATRIAGDIKLANAGDTQTLIARLADSGMRLDARATLAGNLITIEQARLAAGAGRVDLAGSAALSGDQAFKVTANSVHFNPASFGDYPAADINADIHASGHIAPAWKVAADFALRQSRLFNQPLSGKGKLDADASHVSNVAATLAFGQNTVDLRGSFGAPGEKLLWSVDGEQLSAARGDLYGALKANGAITGTMAAPRTSFVIDANNLGWVAAARKSDNGVLHASGEAWLLPARAGGPRVVEVKASGSAQRFNPAAFGSFLPGSINGTFDASARAGADWRAALNLTLQPSTLSNAPLWGYAKLAADPRHISNADVGLHVGPNVVTARGSFGNGGDQLAWRIDAAQLAVLGPDFGGALKGSGTLSGSVEAPSLVAALEAHNLRLLGKHQVKSLRASATLGSGQGAADLLVSDIEVIDYASGTARLASARLQTSGTRGAHALRLAARGDNFDTQVEVHGGWNAGAWNGTIDKLQNAGRYALALQAPAPLRLAGAPGSGVMGLAKPELISLSNAVIKLPEGSISIQSLEKSGPRWTSKGAATGVPLNYLAQFSQAMRDNLAGDLTLGAQWALDLQAPSSPGATPAMSGMLHVFREKGDLVAGSEVPVVLGLRKFDARADVAGGALRVQMEIDGTRAGNARIDATAGMLGGRLGNDSPLTLSASADMGSIAWLAPLSGQPALELDGALKLALTGTGTVGAPTLNGNINGDNLALRWPDQGVKLRNGILRAQLAGDQLVLQRLSFEGVQGRAQADGVVRFSGGEATMQLKLVAERLEILSRPDRTVVVSGQTTLVRDARQFTLEGKFKVDRAQVELAPLDRPVLSDDVIVLGRTKGGLPPKEPAPAMPLTVDVEVDLGDNFHLRGMGIDADLAGAAHLRATSGRPPRVNGTIRLLNGKYDAYGQKLTIERGVLTFNGPYDNPSLNILALRKRPEGDQLTETNVEAGVEIRGTAQAPVAKLVSTPSVPDSEKLSWLVLGHGLEGTSGNEAGVLSAAAAALLGGKGGGGFTSRLANSLGVDELGVSQAKGLESTVVTVGKRISSRAYLSFEQGATTATSLVKLRYKLNPRITLQLQTGTNTALDVLYSWAFD